MDRTVREVSVRQEQNLLQCTSRNAFLGEIVEVMYALQSNGLELKVLLLIKEDRTGSHLYNMIDSHMNNYLRFTMYAYHKQIQ